MVYETWESAAMKEEPLEKNVELKCMKVNVLKRLSTQTILDVAAALDPPLNV